MRNETDIQQELQALGSTLPGTAPRMPHTVPAGYFQQLDAAVRNNINGLSETLTIHGAGKTMPYADVPAGYFNALPAAMLAVAASASPVAVPLAPKLKTKIIALRQVRWAAAALLIMGIGLGSYSMLFTHTDTGTDKLLSSVPNSELHDYLQSNYHVDVDRVVNNNVLKNMQLDNKDIISYLDETGWDVVD